MESMTFKEKEQEDKRTFVEKRMKSNVLLSAA